MQPSTILYRLENLSHEHKINTFRNQTKPFDMIPLKRPATFPIVGEYFKPSNTLKNLSLRRILETKPMKVNNYEELVDLIAKLAYFNRRYILFFRGQPEEYPLETELPTIFPTYFRKLITKEKAFSDLYQSLDRYQFDLLYKLMNREQKFHGTKSLWERLHVRWAMLQHYNICDTPVLDVTQSLHVAASFAIDSNKISNSKIASGIIYVLALPWPSKNYPVMKEDDIYLIRLLGITPPQAKRPYRQEAFAVMSTDVETKQIGDLDRYNFANRVVCKFEVNNSRDFWGDSIKPLTKKYLVPEDDRFYGFMENEVRTESHTR